MSYEQPEQLEFEFIPEGASPEKDDREVDLFFNKDGKLELDNVAEWMKQKHPEWTGEDIAMRINPQKSYLEEQWKRKRRPEDFDPMMK